MKKTGTFEGQSNKLGEGGRAAQLKAQGMSGGLIGYIGRKLHGKKQMAKWSSKGRKDSNKSKPEAKTVPKGIAVGNPKMVK